MRGEAASQTQLSRLEAEAIFIIREVVAECQRPVLLYSVGKDSSVLLHLARKAFYPGRLPFPLLHVESGWDYRELIELRDRTVREHGLDLIIARNEDASATGVNPFDTPTAIYIEQMLTDPLRQALDRHGFDAAFGGARRDEEKARAKERIVSVRGRNHQWDPKSQRPELWSLFNNRVARGGSLRVFPLSNWTELDIWSYIQREAIELVPLYFSRPRPVVERDGMLIIVDDERMPLLDGEVARLESVRCRTLGCYPLTGADRSEAATLADIIMETVSADRSERSTRVIDHDQPASMERRKQAGYF